MQSQNKHGQDIKAEKELLSETGKKNIGFISKAMTSLNTDREEILFGESIHTHIEVGSPPVLSLREYTPEHAQYNMECMVRRLKL